LAFDELVHDRVSGGPGAVRDFACVLRIAWSGRLSEDSVESKPGRRVLSRPGRGDPCLVGFPPGPQGKGD